MTIERADYSSCDKRPFRDTPGVCRRCGELLLGRRTAWCSEACEANDRRQHIWGVARDAVLHRDGHVCVLCGSSDRLEVNHRTPRVGRGYLTGCWNHHDNLETVCKPCHNSITREQIASRKQQGWEQLADFVEVAR